MTNIKLLILVISIGFMAFKQPSSQYILSINIGEIIKEGKQTYLVIPVAFTNNSNDTLNYYSMSCSWQDSYLVNNNDLQVAPSMCFRNGPIVLTLAPDQTRSVELRLIITQPAMLSNTKIKIGFNLVQVPYTPDPNAFEDYLKNKNVIWSNEIII